jgi:hypothetical protein
MTGTTTAGPAENDDTPSRFPGRVWQPENVLGVLSEGARDGSAARLARASEDVFRAERGRELGLTRILDVADVVLGRDVRAQFDANLEPFR